MKYLVSILLLFPVGQLHAQSICHYLCNDQVYISSEDGSTIAFYKNGKVAIDGKVDQAFTYTLEDCTITLYYRKKAVNTLQYSDGLSEDAAHFNGLTDTRKIRYVHLKATLTIQPVAEKH